MLRLLILLPLILSLLVAAPARATAPWTEADQQIPCAAAPWFAATRVPAGPSVQRTCSVLQAYLVAYNRHDLAGVLATLDPQQVRVADCDFVWHQSDVVRGTKAVKQWPRDRFAEDDRFQATVVVGGVIGSGGDDLQTPRVFTLDGTRSSNVITAQGMRPYDVGGSKGLMSEAGDRIQALVLGDLPHCEANDFQSGASAPRTRTLAQAFLDAYDAHDLPRVLQTLGRNVTYVDCDETHRTTAILHGKGPVARWVRTRFRDGDRLEPGTTIAVNPVRPKVARIQAARTSQSLRARGLAPLGVELRLVAGPPAFDHIGAVRLTVRNGRCTP